MKQLVNNFVNTLADTPQVAYTATKDTKIDAFTATNNSSVNASYKAYIVPSAGTAENAIIAFRIVVWGEKDLGIGLVNQILPSGYSLQIESSAVDSIYFTISGREIEA